MKHQTRDGTNTVIINMGSTRIRPDQAPTKAQIGLGNVDNTSDANKPVSGPQQVALNLKENLSNKQDAVDVSKAGGYPTSAAVADYVSGRIDDALSTAFQRDFANVNGVGAEVGDSPTVTGSDGDRTFTLTWSGAEWQIVCWIMQGGAWDRDTANPAITARDLHWVAVASGSEITGHYVMGASNQQANPPAWELLGPDLSNFYTKDDVDGMLDSVADAIGGKQDKSDALSAMGKDSGGNPTWGNNTWPIVINSGLTFIGRIQSSSTPLLGLEMSTAETGFNRRPFSNETFMATITGTGSMTGYTWVACLVYTNSGKSIVLSVIPAAVPIPVSNDSVACVFSMQGVYIFSDDDTSPTNEHWIYRPGTNYYELTIVPFDFTNATIESNQTVNVVCREGQNDEVVLSKTLNGRFWDATKPEDSNNPIIMPLGPINNGNFPQGIHFFVNAPGLQSKVNTYLKITPVVTD